MDLWLDQEVKTRGRVRLTSWVGGNDPEKGYEIGLEGIVVLEGHQPIRQDELVGGEREEQEMVTGSRNLAVHLGARVAPIEY